MKLSSEQDDTPDGYPLKEAPADDKGKKRSNCWVFIVVNHSVEGRVVFAKDVLYDRVSRGIWIVNSRNPNVKRLREGDEVVFYLGGKGGSRGFAGIGVLASEPHPLTVMGNVTYGSPSSRFDQVVDLRDTVVWNKVKPVTKILPRLDFVRNKSIWGAYLQGGIVRISKRDLELLIEA